MSKSLTVQVNEGDSNKGFLNAVLGTLLILGILGLVFWGIWSFISYIAPFILVIYAGYIVFDESKTLFSWSKYQGDLSSLNDMANQASEKLFKPDPELSDEENRKNQKNHRNFTFIVLIGGLCWIMLDYTLRVFVTYYFGSAQAGHMSSFIGFFLVIVFAFRVLKSVPLLFKYILHRDKEIKGSGKVTYYFFVVFNKIVKVLVILFYGMCLAANFGIYIGW